MAALAMQQVSTAQAEHDLCVPVADLLLVGLRQIDGLHDCDGCADVAGTLLLVERTVGGKQDMVRSEEGDAADRRRARSRERRVAVEALEIIEGSLLELLEKQRSPRPTCGRRAGPSCARRGPRNRE